MGKSVQKSTKVAASPAAASPAVTNKSANKGKRDTDQPIDKLVSAKKQKLDLIAQQAIQKKIIEKVQPNESGSESEDGDESGSESEDVEEPVVTATPVKNGKLTAPATQVKPNADGSDEEDESDDEEGEGSESDSEDEKPAEAAKVDNASDEEYSEGDDEEDSSEGEEVPTKKTKVAKVEAKASNTPQIQSGEAKTLFIGNLAFSVEQSDVEKFFKNAGEVVGVRLASDAEGKFRGFGHVDFATPKAAKKALELNGKPLLGRDVKLDLAKERTERSEKTQAGGGLTIFVRGFDTSGGEDKVKSVLEEHFGPCGDITRIHIPKDYDTSEIKGMAYLDFSDKESLDKALEYNGEELGGRTLQVEAARPKGDSSGGRGGRGGGRGFGGGRGGGRGFGGGRGGGGRGFGGGRGGGRGRGGGGRRGGGGGRRGGSMHRFD